MQLAEIAGLSLGQRSISYDDRTTILYALCAGAAPTELDLIWETQLRPLPSLATALGLWAVEAAGDLGAYDRTRSLHVGQRLTMRAPLPASGSIDMASEIETVWDKGRAAIVEIAVRSDYFDLGYTIFLPGMGGFGGESGPKAAESAPFVSTTSVERATSENLALLYRLTGDRHPVHVDPATAATNGFDRPILHGLCTLAIGAHAAASAVASHPADLVQLSARFASPVLPGQQLTIATMTDDASRPGRVRFEMSAADVVVLKDGVAEFRV